MKPTQCLPRIAVLVPLFAGILGVGCGDDTTINVNTPTGDLTASVSGRVIAHPSGQVMPDASVELLGQSTAATSDAAGMYRLESLGPGSYDLIVSAAGHARSRVSLSVPTASGNGPEEIHIQRDLYLLETSASLAVNLFLGTATGVASGAEIELGAWAFPPGAVGHSLDIGAAPASAVADSAGSVVLSGLPATTVQLIVAPYDSDGDGVADFGTAARSVSLQASTLETMNVILPLNVGSIEILQSNIPTSYGAPTSEIPFYFLFSTNMDPAATTATLTRTSYPSAPVGVSLVWPVTHRLEVTPTVPLEDDINYSMYVNAVSAAGIRRTFTYPFVFREAAGGGNGSGTCPDVVTDLALAAGHPPVDFDTVDLALEWTAVPCAGGYNIYAKDDRNNAAGWVFLKNEPTDYEYGVVSSLVTLGPTFDLYQADGIQTPLAGIDVTLAVVPVDAVDPSADSGHAQLTVSDQVAPSLGPAYQSGDGQNLTGAVTVVELSASFSEYVGLATPDPTIEIQEAGGDPAFALNPADGIWSWDSGRRSGKFRFPLQPGDNASGDQFRITVTGLSDFAGNVAAGSSTTPWTPILPVSDSFDFEGSPQAWTVTGTAGWEWGTPLSGPSAAHSGSGCFGTDLDAFTQFGWNSSLISPPMRVPVSSPTLAFWYWSYFGPNQFCDVNVNGQTLTRLSYTNTSWTFLQLPLDTFAGQVVTVELRFDSTNGTSYSRDGIFVDDISITGGP